ncbi:MAG: hypothetical protein M3Y86_09260 [Verrucomicrobiota bacterium]|nr:hypothetical protein [Verrucomicrobiota bacterium]
MPPTNVGAAPGATPAPLGATPSTPAPHYAPPPHKRSIWPWVGGCGCLAIILVIVGLVVLYKIGKNVESHYGANGHSMVGNWKIGDDDGKHIFKNDGTFVDQAYSKDSNGKDMELDINGKYRVDSDVLYLTYLDLHILNNPEAKMLEPQFKQSAAPQLKFGQEHKVEMHWTDDNTFTGVPDGNGDPTVWTRQ